jgi:hypothetical protein
MGYGKKVQTLPILIPVDKRFTENYYLEEIQYEFP